MGGGPFRPDNRLAGPRSVKRWLAHPLTRDVRLDEAATMFAMILLTRVLP